MSKLPGRRSKTPLLTEEQKKTESKFYRCPKGHSLPNRTNQGNCTPIFCAGSKPGKKEKKAKGPKMQDLGEVTTTLAKVASAGAEEMELVTTAKIQQAAGRFKARKNYVKLPEFQNPDDRDAWVEQKKGELVPYALMDLEYAVTLGDSQEREKARKEILDITGHGKAGAPQGQPMIIIHGFSGNPQDLPWVQRVEVPKLPPGKVTNEKK
jgi:hypothetical protein